MNSEWVLSNQRKCQPSFLIESLSREWFHVLFLLLSVSVTPYAGNNTRNPKLKKKNFFFLIFKQTLIWYPDDDPLFIPFFSLCFLSSLLNSLSSLSSLSTLYPYKPHLLSFLKIQTPTASRIIFKFRNWIDDVIRHSISFLNRHFKKIIIIIFFFWLYTNSIW